MQPAVYISCLDPDPNLLDPPIYTHAAVPYFLTQHQFHKYNDPSLIQLCAKTMHSTKMAADVAKPTPLTHIPAPFQKYHSVFSEKASYHFLKH
jgi:hypothetical protein